MQAPIERFLTPPSARKIRKPAPQTPEELALYNSGCDGFDEFAGKRWIYPNNMKIRTYQRSAVELALFNNAMIALPTGFGKTFIAAVVMYNFYLWYPRGKIIFVAPTRPLVAQQIRECKKICGLTSKDCVELTGSINPDKRHELWHSSRVFFATPQVIQNDLQSQLVPASAIKCLVIDEAHRAQGGYAYVEIVRLLQTSNRDGFRILALSATPGSNIDKVRSVMMNLFISDVMFKREDDLDLMSYKNTKLSKAFTVDLEGKHKQIVDKFVAMSDRIILPLYQAGALYTNDSRKVTSYMCVMAMKKITMNQVVAPRGRGRLMIYGSAAIAMTKALEFLTVYGLRPFYHHMKSSFEDRRKHLRTALQGDLEADKLMHEVEDTFGEYIYMEPDRLAPGDLLLRGHPKLDYVNRTLKQHFEQNKDVKETRAIVFTKFRDSVLDIVQTLRSASEPILKCHAFVGQGNKEGEKGMRQKEQLEIIQKFKEGTYNVLVATCVAEEGLDIGEVDLIICYDTSSSPISTTQRRGRTGRKRKGDVYTILTKEWEEKKLNKASSSRRSIEQQLFNRETYMTSRYHRAPRMVPYGIEPEMVERKIYVEEEEVEEERPKKKRRKKDVQPTDDPFKDLCSDKKDIEDYEYPSSYKEDLAEDWDCQSSDNTDIDQDCTYLPSETKEIIEDCEYLPTSDKKDIVEDNDDIEWEDW